MAWAYGRQTADTSLMRFVSHRFFSPATFLDIGSGEGANAEELEGERGYRVVTVDKDVYTQAEYHTDIQEIEFEPHSFNLVYDINTLCHVETPPFEKIKNWLKPEGIFFSICPTALAPEYVALGKDFTRRADELELRWLLEPFFPYIKIRWRSEPDWRPGDPQLESWIVEARP